MRNAGLDEAQDGIKIVGININKLRYADDTTLLAESEEGFLISPCYSLELCIQMGISLLFSFAFHFSSIHSYL